METDIVTEQYLNDVNNSVNKELGNVFRKYNLFEGEVSFGRNNFIFDNDFLKQLLTNQVYKNTVEDLTIINLKNDLNKKLDELNTLIDTKQSYEHKLYDFVKTLKENNINEISLFDFRKITKTNSVDNVDIEKIKERLAKKDVVVKVDLLIKKMIDTQNNKIDHLEKSISQLLIYDELVNKNFEVGELILKNSKETLEYLGTPVPLKKLKHAISKYVETFIDGTEDDKKHITEAILKQNIFDAKRTYFPGATNAFYEENKRQEDERKIFDNFSK